MIRFDTQRLKIAMAIAGINTEKELAKRSGVDARAIRYIKERGTLTFETWNKLALAIGCNPLDLIVTDGHPKQRKIQ